MADPKAHETHPDPVALTHRRTPHQAWITSLTPQVNSIQRRVRQDSWTDLLGISIPASRQKIVDAITSLYSGSASEEDMLVYTEKAIYDDPWSYCEDRYRIAGQWYGIPKIMASSKTLATEIVSSTDSEIVFKLRQEYRPHAMPSKAVNSLVSLALVKEGDVERVKYHKDMWNEKDYSHEGLGKVMKTLNGDHLTKITQPPESLKDPGK